MLKKCSTVLSVFVLFVAPCFGQQNGDASQEPQVEINLMSVGREERSSINVGAFMGGGGLIGGDVETLISNRVGLQLGTGWVRMGSISMGLGINYHFKPYINSSFVSLQYSNNFNIGATIGPMLTLRSSKVFQIGLGYGAVVSKYSLWEEVYDKKASALIHFNIGLYFPL